MSQESAYLLTSFTAGLIAMALVAILAGFKVRSCKGLRKYNRARWCLLGAFSVFGVLNLLEVILIDRVKLEAGTLTGSLIIVIGSFMALFFTFTVLSFIRPEIVTRKNLLLQIAVIAPLGILPFILGLTAPRPVFRIFFALMLVAYLALLVTYTRLFLKSYRMFKERMLSFYEEEDLVDQLHWINWTFWMALSVGVLALLLLTGNLVVSSALNVVFIIYFLILCISFINYRQYAPLVDRAIEQRPAEPEAKEVDDSAPAYGDLAEKVEEWVERKGYLDNTKSVEEIAREMGWYHSAFRKYIHQTTGEDFRSWRIRLRIEEACRIMAEQPGLPIAQVATMAGFNDRSYFYRTFQKVTGTSVRAYQESLK